MAYIRDGGNETGSCNWAFGPILGPKFPLSKSCNFKSLIWGENAQSKSYRLSPELYNIQTSNIVVLEALLQIGKKNIYI
jgi:hypothetical protein